MFSRGTVKKIVSPGPATSTTNLKGKVAQQFANLYPNNAKLCHRGAVREPSASRGGAMGEPSGSCQGAVGEPSYRQCFFSRGCPLGHLVGTNWGRPGPRDPPHPGPPMVKSCSIKKIWPVELTRVSTRVNVFGYAGNLFYSGDSYSWSTRVFG